MDGVLTCETQGKLQASQLPRRSDYFHLKTCIIFVYVVVVKYKTSDTLIKNENKLFLIYKEIQAGLVAKSYMRKGFLIYEEMLNLQLIPSEFPYI
jgi:hypothetical protein